MAREYCFLLKLYRPIDKKCIANIKSWEAKPKTWNYHLHIAIAPTKLNDRFEWFLEKATEIGIDEITPVFCDHSERRQLKAERMEKVITSAMKQSLKFNKPVLNRSDEIYRFYTEKGLGSWLDRPL